MAKKLIYNYEFTPGGANAGVIKFKGRHPQRTLLLVTNTTRSTIIYNFAGSGFGGTVTYDAANDESTLTLEADTSAHNSADELQIFLDIREDKIDFSETFTDPVSKLRVSNPQNLIDTDFEYGLQPTKWETIELVNNVPSFFSSNESYAIGDVTSVLTSQGSKDVTVTTLEPHGLSVGSPFEIQGLSQKTAEGKYLVSNVASTTVFSYNAKKKQTSTVDVSGSYTIVTPGQFYESADIAVAGGINTNEATKTTLEVTTDFTHGFENGSSIYLTNTFGNEAYNVDNGADTSGDGRPFIDSAQTVNTTIDLDEVNIVTREMNSTYFFEFFDATVDLAANKILWPNSNLRVGDVLLYLSAPYDTAIGGLTRQEFYYVKSVDSAGITLCQTTNGAYTTNSTITLSSVGTYNYGPHSLHLAYELRRVRKAYRNYYQYAYSRFQSSGSGSGWDLQSNPSTYGLGGAFPDRVMWVDRSSSSGNFNSFINYNQVYASYMDSDFTMGKSSVGITNDSEFMENFDRYDDYGSFRAPQNFFSSYIRFYNNNASFYASVDRTLSDDNVFLILLKRNTEAETFFKLDHGLSNGDTLTLTTQSGSDLQYHTRSTNNISTDASLTSVASGSTGTVTVLDPNRFKLDFISGYTGVYDDKKLAHIRGQYQLSGTFGNDKKNSVYVGSNNLTDNQRLTITTTSSFPTTQTGIVTPTPNTINTVYNTTKSWVEGKVTTAGADHGQIFFNNSQYYQPVRSNRVYNGTYGDQYFYIQHLRYSETYLYTSSMSYIGRWSHSHGNSPQPSNEVAIDKLSGNSLFRNRGFYYIASPWAYNTSSNYYIFIEQIPDISDIYNTSNVRELSQIYSYNYTGTSVYSYQTIDRNHSNWKTIAGGWRYMYAYRYQIPNATYQGMMSISLILDNSNFPMYQENQSYAQWNTNNSRNPWAGSSNYYGGQRYHVNILVPQKKNTGSTLYETNQTDAETLVDSLATSITSSISYPSFTSPSTTAYVQRLDNNRINLLGAPNGELFRFTGSGSDLSLSTDLQRGGVDGEYVITNTNPTQFRTIAPYKINGRDISVVFGNIVDSEFTSTAHKLLNGSKVTYTEVGGASVSELTSGNEYYVHVTGPDTFKLSNNNVEASNGITIGFTSPTSGSITIGVKNISSRQEADGTVTLNAADFKVLGTNTTFTQYFKPGDTLVVKNGGTTPATFEEYVVSVVTDDAELYVQNAPVDTLTNTQFYIDTKIYVKPDGSSQHRPFDGGVEINAGSSPNSSIVRQTRKYFRYQSGKGIQCSLAINFNPSRLVNTVTGVSNSVLAAKTKEVLITNIDSILYNLYGEDRFGTVIGDNKPITIIKGDTLRLVVSAAGHPTWIQSSARSSGTGPTNAVTTGISNNGATSGTIIWDTTNVTAGTYYYQCANHHLMQGQIVVEAAPSANSLVTMSTSEPHGLNRGNTVKIAGADQSEYNGTFDIVDADDFSFTYECADSGTARTLTTGTPGGLLNYNPGNYTNAAIRCGLFDYQNGFFFEYDGTDLYAVRRSSVQQISGRSSVVSGSNIVDGTDTAYSRQLSVGDMVVIRGSSYRVTAIGSDTNIHIQPAYKGINSTDAVVTKTIDTKVAQSNWNIDKADGTGPSGFDLDITKIQMAYLDYSWYGAGKIRFGFKDTHGHVKYMHEFIHNNQLDEAYMRSGNIPGRYEIENTGGEVGFIPALFHWGTSVMMDGGFDDDKAYLFTASSNDLTFTNGDSASINTADNSSLIWNYNYGERRFYWYVKIPFATTDAGSFSTGVELYTAGQELNGEKVDYTDYADGNFNVYIFISRTRRYTPPVIYPSVSSGTAVSVGAPASGPVADAVDLTQDIPLISIRLAPSVDNNLTGALGARDIINRMQLQLKQLGITVTHDCTVDLILNGAISTRTFDKVQEPSLSELVRHQSGDRIIGGTKVFSLRASGGQGNATSVTEDFDLSQISDLGNSILGGDGVFPNGPDMLTIALVPNDTSLINATTPLKVSSRITWTESQA